MAYIKDSVIGCFKKQLCELEHNPDKFSRVKAKFLKNYVIVTLEASKTDDVVEVKHGYNKSSMNPVDEFICSECGAMFADVSLVKEDEENGDINYYEFEFKYCPNCGAKMSEIPTGSKRSVDG